MPDERDKDRRSRLGAALRENLKRRKQQLRARAESAAPRSDGEGAGEKHPDRARSGSENDRD